MFPTLVEMCGVSFSIGWNRTHPVSHRSVYWHGHGDRKHGVYARISHYAPKISNESFAILNYCYCMFTGYKLSIIILMFRGVSNEFNLITGLTSVAFSVGSCLNEIIFLPFCSVTDVIMTYLSIYTSLKLDLCSSSWFH